MLKTVKGTSNKLLTWNEPYHDSGNRPLRTEQEIDTRTFENNPQTTNTNLTI